MVEAWSNTTASPLAEAPPTLKLMLLLLMLAPRAPLSLLSEAPPGCR
jgi:hypothetical protein